MNFDFWLLSLDLLIDFEFTFYWNNLPFSTQLTQAHVWQLLWPFQQLKFDYFPIASDITSCTFHFGPLF